MNVTRAVVVLVLLALLGGSLSAATRSATSPDGRNVIRLVGDRPVRVEVLRDGASVSRPQPVALVTREHGVLDAVAGDGWRIELKATDAGVAYRFVTAFDGEITVLSETGGLGLAESATVYAGLQEMAESGTTSERMFVKLSVADLVTKARGQRLITPLTGRTADGVWFAFKDAAVLDYPCAGLSSSLSFSFARVPETSTVVPDARFRRVHGCRDHIARTSGRREFPWRAMQLASSPGGLVEGAFFESLAPASAIADTSWIRPGLCAWDWWTEWNLTGVPFKAGPNTESYLHWVDFAAEFGLPYVLLDGGWAVDLDPMRIKPEVDLPRVIRVAAEKGVKVILWASWSSLWGRQREVFGRYAAMGVAGFKIDYFSRDDQTVCRFMEETARIAAEYRLVVDWHGCMPPTGLEGKYPNILTWEGVYGLEMAKFRADVTNMPPHDVRLVFTRMLAGPADYTPGAMLMQPKDCFRPNRYRPATTGTRVHQMALYTLLRSPLQMLSDTPGNYRLWPDITRFLARIPTVWDETRFLGGDPDTYVALARRKGDAWLAAAATGWEARRLEIDTAFLGRGRWKAVVFADGVNAGRDPMDYARSERVIVAGERIPVALVPGGGWTARFERMTEGDMQ